MRELMREAHKMTKEIKKEFPSVDYKAQLGLCMSYLLNEKEEKMVELKGSEKQIKWAESIRSEIISICEKEINKYEEAQQDRMKTVKKRTKIYDKRIEKLNNLISEVSEVSEAKILIEEYRQYSKYEIEHIL